MRTSILIAFLMAGCASPLPPAHTPPPREPQPDRNTVSGTITTPRGAPADGALVVVRECNGKREWGAVADERGQYQVDVEADCVTVEASAGGAMGRSTTTSVRLQPAPDLTERRAQELIDTLLRAIGGDDEAVGALETYTPHHADALRVALENFRLVAGTTPVAKPVRDSLIRGFEYEVGPTRVYVTGDDTHRVTGPLFEYSWRGAQYVTTFARLIAAGDAERLARLLNPDDVEYPVEDARKLIARMQPRLDWMRSRARFTGIDERTIQFELTDGTRGVGVALAYGDGLLSLREDLLR
jgi:hypothetical protein